MHTIVGAGAAEGAIDAANIFKPALGRGELQMLGATTLEEYRKYIEKDAALERRFRAVAVEEPGSETTLATVITDDKNYHKFPISDFPLIPRVAVLDPEMTRSLPPHMTSTTGMDALTHAIEAYIGRSTTRQTRADALRAAKLIAENLENAYRDGSDMTARANMLQAAFLAGGAFSKSYVGYCHAVAHSLGGMYHIPHGLANAVLLPYVLESYGPAIYKKAKDIAIAMGIADASTGEEAAAKELIVHIRQMNSRMGIPTKLSGIQEKDIPQLAAYAEKEANPLYPVPVLMTREELKQFYYDVMEEKT